MEITGAQRSFPLRARPLRFVAAGRGGQQAAAMFGAAPGRSAMRAGRPEV